MRIYGKILLFFTVLLVILTGCGDDFQNTKEGPIELEYWVLFGGGDLDFMQEIVDDYNESQDDVEVNMVLQDFDEYYTKLVTSVAADRGPDIAVSHASVLPDLVNQGLTIPLDSIGEEAKVDWSSYNENILEATKVNGEIHATPMDTLATVLYLNTDIAKEAGMIDEEGNMLLEEETPEGFINFFNQVNEANMDETPLAFPTGGIDSYRVWWTFYHQMGGNPIFEGEEINDVEVSIDKDIAIKAVKYLKDLYYEKDIVPLNLADFNQEFQSENAAGIISGVWGTGIWEGADMNFEAYPFPTLFKQDGGFGNSHTLMMPQNEDTSKEKQLAGMEFMEYVTTKGALTWAEAGHLPANNETVESEEFQEMPYRSDYAEVADYVDYPPKTIYYRPAETEMIRNIDEIVADRITPEQGIENMIEDLEVVIN